MYPLGSEESTKEISEEISDFGLQIADFGQQAAGFRSENFYLERP